MQAVSFSELRKSMKHIMDTVENSHEPTIITRTKGAHMVLMSLDDYNALEETAYILRNPHNARHVLSSIEELKAGKAKTRSLVEHES